MRYHPRMRVFITGATGFIGGAIARELVARGHTLRALVRNQAKVAKLEALGVETARGDLEDPASLAEAARGAEAVMHVAGITAEPLPGDFTHVNANGTRNVLEAAAAAASVRRFVYLSTMSAVGPGIGGAPLVEDQPCEPISAYGRSKHNAERLVRAYRERFAVTILRPALVYGPGDVKLLPLFKLARWGVTPTFGSDGQRLSVIHVDDVARGVAMALDEPRAANETFFLAHPDAPTTRELVRSIGLAAGADPLVIAVPPTAAFGAALVAEGLGRMLQRPSPFNAGFVAELLGDSWLCATEHARDELGFSAAIGLTEGLEQAATWYASRPLLL